MSGYDDQSVARGQAPPANGILAKPFTDRELTAALRDAAAAAG